MLEILAKHIHVGDLLLLEAPDAWGLVVSRSWGDTGITLTVEREGCSPQQVAFPYYSLVKIKDS